MPQNLAPIDENEDVPTKKYVDDRAQPPESDASYNTDYGVSAAATGGSATTLGYGATASAPNGVAVGKSANSSADSGVVVGAMSSAAASGVTIGYNAKSPGGEATAIGMGADASGNRGVAIGKSAKAVAATSQAIAIGVNAQAGASQAVAIGGGAQAMHAGSVALGNRADNGGAATTTATNQIMLGTSLHTVQVPGTLILTTDPAVPLEAATKQYVDNKPSGGPDEVTVATGQPVTSTDLWVDTSTAGGTPPNYVAKGGDTMTGPLTTPFLTSTGGLQVQRPSGSSANVEFTTGGSLRWTMGKGPGAETGADAGAEFNIAAWDDAGNWKSNPLSINRANKRVTLSGTLDVPEITSSVDDIRLGNHINAQNNTIWGLRNPPVGGDWAVTKDYADTKVTKTGDTMSGALRFGSVVATAPEDLSKHIDLYAGAYGLSITGSSLNVVCSGGQVYARKSTGTLANINALAATAPDHVVTYAGSQGVLVPASGWVDLGGNNAGLWATRSGPVVVLDGIIGRGSDLAVTAGTGYQLVTVPVGFRPSGHYVNGPAIYTSLANTQGALGRIRVDTSGVLLFVPFVATTIRAGEYVTITLSYRGA